MKFLRHLTPLNVLFWAVLTFLLLPLIVVIPVSFSPSTVLHFPPAGLSWRWYEDFFGDDRWVNAAWLSIRVGVSVAIVSTLIGMLAAVALTRFITFGKGLVRSLVLSPLIVPLIITSVGVYYVMSELGMNSTFQGILIGHTVLALPYSVIIIESALRAYDVTLDEAAVSLGASRVLTFRKITMPIIMPSILASATFAFITSWDDVLLVTFLGGPSAQTLPLRMFEFLTTQVRPTIAAISSMLIVTLVGLMLLYQLTRWQRSRWRERSRSRDPWGWERGTAPEPAILPAVREAKLKEGGTP
jgi:ABC-type spermidine/putrescine transport system permease subunit II